MHNESYYENGTPIKCVSKNREKLYLAKNNGKKKIFVTNKGYAIVNKTKSDDVVAEICVKRNPGSVPLYRYVSTKEEKLHTYGTDDTPPVGYTHDLESLGYIYKYEYFSGMKPLFLASTTTDIGKNYIVSTVFDKGKNDEEKKDLYRIVFDGKHYKIEPDVLGYVLNV